MTRRLAAASVLAVVLLVAVPGAHAATHTVTIASFNYAPADLRVSVGDTVEWRNLDPTVHTVTASRGEFGSGSMRQGQRFRATFNAPGVYPYFCEPHETMQALVSVTGPAGTTATTAAPVTTTTVVVSGGVAPAPRPPTATTVTVTGATSTTSTAAPAADPTAPPPAAAVVASAVTGETHQASPVLSLLALFAAVGGLLGVLARAGVRGGDACRYAAAAATAATAALHLQLRIALDYPEPIGTLLVVEAAAGAVLTTWLLARPFTRRTQLAAIGAHVAALIALAITRTGVGLFGFHEIGWDPSPQVPLAVAIGVVAVALLSAARRAQ